MPSESGELDEMYHYMSKKAKTETKENVYVIALASREPRQFLGLVASRDKSPGTTQSLVWDSPHATKYFSDGYLGYRDVHYPGHFKQNVRTKDDTFTVEGANADLRCYIPTLARRSRCFPRKIENMNSVLRLFSHAYSLFGQWKLKTRRPVRHKSASPDKRPHKFKYPRLSHLDFL